MTPPMLPERFLDRQCANVAEAKRWRRNFNLAPDPSDDRQYAACEFESRGVGQGCTTCERFFYPGSRCGEQEAHADVMTFLAACEEYNCWLADQSNIANYQGEGI
jgi:hypothetical protein